MLTWGITFAAITFSLGFIMTNYAARVLCVGDLRLLSERVIMTLVSQVSLSIELTTRG